jgi:hypothetical protein
MMPTSSPEPSLPADELEKVLVSLTTSLQKALSSVDKLRSEGIVPSDFLPILEEDLATVIRSLDSTIIRRL